MCADVGPPYQFGTVDIATLACGTTSVKADQLGSSSSSNVAVRLRASVSGDLGTIRITSSRRVVVLCQARTVCTWPGRFENAGSLALAAISISGRTTNAGWDNAGVIKTTGGSLAIAKSTFSKNKAPNAYGGVLSIQGGDTIVQTCTFQSNIARDGGAIFLLHGTATIKGSLFNANSADKHLGGAVFMGGGMSITGRLIIINCKFSSNHAGSGGVIYADGGAYLRLTSSRFSSNYADYHANILCKGSQGSFPDTTYTAKTQSATC